MKNFEELSSLWIAQPQKEQLNVETLLKQVKKEASGLKQKLFWGSVLMAATLVFLVCLFLFFLFDSWVTYVGIFITMSTILIYTLLMFRDYRLLAKHDATVEVNVYLQKLKKYQNARKRMYGLMYYVYTILLTLGLSLYLIEILKKSSVWFEVFAYSIFFCWMLFVTFYLRKRIIKTEQEKISEIINRLERLKLQFKD